ncbi:hypothetical protein PbJCM13498_20610 [Prolixibacter bellariivorans]|uniref:Lipoprotein n=1 Tax=Prolixibacter bellariivorans TaxID=314319 RepID=A0A5M4AZQ6_9BACT|nr:hypothetical protein [Prolixibacter bellariivorans]GET33198.1 hypothetical protein PbJCM13498_20610 [Prolixibacter bellariivorans]
MRFTAIVIAILLSSCSKNSKEITKEFKGSTIKASLSNGKFDGAVVQTFHQKDYWLKSLATIWKSGDIRKIVLTDRENVSHDMIYHEEKRPKDKSVTIYYQDKNDSTFRTIPFNNEFIDFCAENAFLSTYSLNNFDTTIKIYNIPANSFKAISSPLPINIENNTIKVTDIGYKTDSLLVTLYWMVGTPKTEFKIKIDKNAP